MRAVLPLVNGYSSQQSLVAYPIADDYKQIMRAAQIGIGIADRKKIRVITG